MEENKSEVAALRAQIEAEHQAMISALSGLAEGSAKHAFITARYTAIGDYQEQLSALAGESESMAFVMAVFNGGLEHGGSHA